MKNRLFIFGCFLFFVGCIWGSSALSSVSLTPNIQGNVSLPTAEFRLVKEQPNPNKGPAPIGGKKLVCFLVDYSRSMQQNLQGGQAKNVSDSRWEIGKKKVREILGTLQDSSPDIEVRVRFFCGKTQPGQHGVPNELSFTSLKGDKVIDEIMDQFPEPLGDHTAYKQAISETCDVLMPQRNKQQVEVSQLEWLLFAVVSDGEDDWSGKAFKEGGGNDWNVKLKQLINSIPGGAMTGVIALGDEAEKAQKAGKFGSLTDLEKTLPKPPVVQDRYLIESLAKNVLQVDALQSLQTYEIPVHLDLLAAGKNAVGTFDVRVIDSPKFVQVAPTNLDANGLGQILVRVAPNVEINEGGVLKIAVTVKDPNAAVAGNGTLVSGTPEAQYRFRPKNVPSDPKKWEIHGFERKFVRINDEVNFTVKLPPLDSSEVKWTFVKSAGGKPEWKSGVDVRHSFSSAGKWTAKITATSNDNVSNDGATIEFEVVDSSCKIEGPNETKLGKSGVFKVSPIGASPAEYQWSVNNVPQSTGLSNGNKTFEWTPQTVGQFKISCDATHKASMFQWGSNEIVVDAQNAPKIKLNRHEPIKEGATEDCFLSCDMYEIERYQWELNGGQRSPMQQNFLPGAPHPVMTSVSIPISVDSLQDAAKKGQPLNVKVFGFCKDKANPQKDTELSEEIQIPIEQVVVQLLPTAQTPKDNQELEFNVQQNFEIKIDWPYDRGMTNPKAEVHVSDVKGVDVYSNLSLPCTAVAPNNGKQSQVFNFSFNTDVKKHASPIHVVVKLSSDDILFAREIKFEAHHPLKLKAAAYLLDVGGEHVAYEVIPIKLVEFVEGDSVAWKLERKSVVEGQPNNPDNWTDKKSVTSSPIGYAPGVLTASAVVTRPDGTMQIVPPVEFLVKSSMNIVSDKDWNWANGPNPPAHSVHLGGTPAEIEHLKNIVWTKAKPSPDSLTAIVDLPGLVGDLPESFVVEVSFDEDGIRQTIRSKPIALKIEPISIAKPTVFTVGGKAGQGVGGGALAFSPPVMSGVEYQDARKVRLTYEPDQLALQRGQAAIDESYDFKVAKTVDPRQTGVWKVEVSARAPRETEVRVVDSSAFTVLRTLNVWELIIFIAPFGLGGVLLFWIGYCRNEPLWQRVSFGSSLAKATSGGEYEVCPCIWPKKSGPRFDLMTKRATCKLLGEDHSPISPAAIRRPDWQWINGIDGSVPVIKWQGGGGKKPEVIDEFQRFANPDVEQVIDSEKQAWKFAPKGKLKIEGSTAIYMCVSEPSGRPFVPTLCGIVALLGFLAGVLYGFFFIL